MRTQFAFCSAIAIAVATLWSPPTLTAGTVILEGSDAIGYHCAQEGQASACQYEGQVWKALDGSSKLPIAVIGDISNVSSQGSGVTIDYFSSVAAAGTLGQYAALYFEAGSGCCAENDSLITATGATTAVGNYLNGGGTVMIEDYIGGLAWDFVVKSGGLANTSNNSVGYGTADAAYTCTDGETVTPTGITNGFTQPAVLNCWEHQAYKQSFFAGLGFNQSFFNADPSAGVGPGYSGLLSNGSTLTGITASPEPLSMFLTGSGLIGLGLFQRRRSRR